MTTASLAAGGSRENEQELVNILIDSDLYLDLNLKERYLLLHFLMASYYHKPAETGEKG